MKTKICFLTAKNKLFGKNNLIFFNYMDLSIKKTQVRVWLAWRCSQVSALWEEVRKKLQAHRKSPLCRPEFAWLATALRSIFAPGDIRREKLEYLTMSSRTAEQGVLQTSTGQGLSVQQNQVGQSHWIPQKHRLALAVSKRGYFSATRKPILSLP